MAALGLLGFALGGLPIWIFNLRTGWSTVRFVLDGRDVGQGRLVTAADAQGVVHVAQGHDPARQGDGLALQPDVGPLAVLAE